MADLPSGTVTFLFTDIEGSTKLAQAHPAEWESARQRHHALLRDAIEAQNGHVFQIIGDAICAAFHTANDAIRATLDAQRALSQADWGLPPIRVRMGLHTGEAQAADGDYRSGMTLNRVARVMSIAYGGQILLSQVTAELVCRQLPDGVNLRDMGAQRLKGLADLERILQVVAPDLPSDFPPLKSLSTVPNNLPLQLTSFIGREKEIAEVRRLLQSTRLLTLTGSGGTGKTRLSLQVAMDQLDQFPDGVWFVELAPLSDPAIVPQTVASVLSVLEQPGRPIQATLADHLRDKHLLLLMDNCEHLIEACSRFVDSLLRAAPLMRILASSREALGIAGETAYRVPSLPIPNLKDGIPAADVAQYDSVRLFVERAQATNSSFTLSDVNALPVSQICQRLDGIPLAIELAAARVKALSVDQIAVRLDDRFRLLTGGSRTALPRQQTLRAAIDWSYRLLSEDECVLLRRLSVFSGGWTLEATETVCAGEGIDGVEVLDLLSHLVDKSLVVLDEQASGPRYRILETVREYAHERLRESGEGEKVRNRHLEYFVHFAEEAEPKLYDAEQAIWLTYLAPEHDNLRAALVSALANSEPESALRLASALERFWDVRGHWSEGRRWLMQALEFGRARLVQNALPQRQVHYTRALNTMSWLAWRQADYGYAQSCAEEALRLAHEQPDKRCMADALLNLGNVDWDHGDYAGAQGHFERGLALSRELGDRRRITALLVKLGTVAGGQADFATARMRFEESLAVQPEGGDKVLRAQALCNLGVAATWQGDYAGAQSLQEQSLALGRELDDKRAIAMSLFHLGVIALRQGDHPTASARFSESLPLFRQLGYKRMLTNFIWHMATLALAEGDLQRATQLASANEALAVSIQLQPEKFIRKDYDQHIATLRTRLDDTTFNAAWEAGRQMTLEQAIAEAEYIIALPSTRSSMPVVTPALPAGLTEREVEVLRLLARGLSNAEIGEQLVVSPRTVGAHLRSIYGKLDVTTRTAAARVAAELKLV